MKQNYRTISMALCLLLALALAVTLPVLGQSGTGTITGLIKDASGAVVPGADVTVTALATGAIKSLVSTGSGVYRASYLAPGDYKVEASLSGFKTAVADKVTVLLAQTVGIDLVLQVGEVSEIVTVSSEGPLLETASAEIGTNVDSKEVHTWPILVSGGTRQLQDFIFRAMPGTSGGSFAGSINGGQSYAHEILIDGISIGRMDLNGGSNSEFTPTMDAVSEFKLQTGALSSQYGGTQTALTNFGLKSGTNEFHGSAFWFYQSRVLNAASWSNNFFGIGKSPFNLNNFGATVGGPIIKDKTHFFFSYEGNRFLDQSTSGFENLPVNAFKKGDFSQLLNPDFTSETQSGSVVGQDALGRDVLYGAIYDPATSRQLADGTWIRDPFPGNVIPTDRFSSVTGIILSQYAIRDPQLNDQLFRNEPRANTCCPELNINNYSLKVDHIISDNHKLGGSFVYNNRDRNRFDAGPRLTSISFPGSPALGTKRQHTPGWIVRGSEDWTVSPQMLNHFAFGFNRFNNKNASFTWLSGEDWVGLLGMNLSGIPGETFPEARFRGNNSNLSGSYRDWGSNAAGFAPNGSWIFSDDFSWLINNHSLKIGGEYRHYFLDNNGAQNTGSYTFHNENSGQPGFVDETGFAFASYILGEAQSTSMGIFGMDPRDRSQNMALYFQDDWKVSSTLTLNLGLRWDIPTPYHEKDSQMSGLDKSLPNDAADGHLGALAFLAPGEKYASRYYGQVAPRIGVAWAINETTVLRAGYGINYSPPIKDGWYTSYTTGFNGSNNQPSRTGEFREAAVYNWDTAYPAYTDELPNLDPTQVNGDSISFYDPGTNRLPLVQNWNVGVQFDVGWDTKIEANYVGNRGSRMNLPMYLNGAQNQVPLSYMSLGDTLLDDIEDHPEIPKPYESFTGIVSQALRPFAQYRGINTHRMNAGWSSYDSLQISFTKRSDFGLSFLGSYTYGKAKGTSDTSGPGNYYDYGQDFYNLDADFSTTQFHYPQDLKFTWMYDLPFGPGGQWVTDGIGAQILGGWTVSAIMRYRSGGPLRIGFGGYDGDALWNSGMRANEVLHGDKQTFSISESDLDTENGTQYLNPLAFSEPAVTDNRVPMEMGNSTRWLGDSRGFGLLSEDFSIIKQTSLGFREGANLELRADIVNLFNRNRLNNPNTGISGSNFGKVFGKGGAPRTIQVGLRINW